MTSLKNSGYTHTKQIQFAIENYFIRSASIYDRALIFVNHFLDLGIADESTSNQQMITNRHVKRYQLTNHLKHLGKVCREKRVERNAIIHHHSYFDDEFNQFSMIISSNAISEQAGKKTPFSCEMVDNLRCAILSAHATDFEKHLIKITQSLNDFLDSAAKVYKIRRASYSNGVDGEAIVQTN